MLFMVSFGAMAKSVVFTLSDGTLVYYLLGGETNPMLRFVDGKVTVNADMYEISDIKNFYISEEDDPSAISAPTEAKKMQFSANTLIIKSSDVKNVKVYSASGAQVKADVQKSGENISVNLNSLPSGAYVVNTGKASFKVMKK